MIGRSDGSGALVIGEALIDIVIRDGRVTGEHVGGSPLNVAVGLARLGRQVDFLTSIGDDEYGQRILDHLNASGVALAEGSRNAARTATAQAVLDENGSATYRFDIHWQPRPAAVASPLVVHTGSIAAVLDPGSAEVATTITRYAPTSTITFDPNLRPQLIDDPPAARTHIDYLVSQADVVKASDEDLRWLEPSLSAEAVAAQWLSQGPAIVAVTLGAQGAFATTHSGTVHVPAAPTEVVDAVGAGDAFMTGLIDALWTQGLLGAENRKVLRDIDSSQLRKALETAALSSSLTVSRPGADLPDRATRDAHSKP
ncbi:carbohydrate kinase family protein [Nocardia blacklockiae]|uniref:carbohydrate kinase family protein n=1 Tax=Nocardia blacklockiae TaxID=480036 RepID=UPI0018941AFB|nr:carbohydrate kinase [Nocardia blacklockiae]MBF6171321.1 carbohydrate kinase [Nocardia blacklockiae]